MWKGIKTFFITALAVMFTFTFMQGLSGRAVFAKPNEEVTQGDFKFMVYYDGGDVPTSVFITGYTGSSAEIILPTAVTVDGKTGHVCAISDKAFAGNTAIRKIAIPKGINSIAAKAFNGCTGLEEIAIEEETELYIDKNAFTGCANLKIYRINGVAAGGNMEECGSGQDTDGKSYSGVVVYTKENSNIDTAVKAVNLKNTNQIKLVYETNPYSNHTVKPTDNQNTNGNTNTGGNNNTVNGTTGQVDRSTQKGKDGTYLGTGAAMEAANKFLTSYKSEKDPAGSRYYPLISKLASNASTLE